MKSNERQKMCTTCDGRIALEALACPYCGAEQSGSGQVYLQHKSIQESLTSLYPPPYAAKNATQSHYQELMPEKKFQHTSASSSPQIHLDNQQEAPIEEKSSFWPLFALTVGSNLLVLGLLQLFFSDNGFLTLQWESRYWFVYCLGALPLFYIGYKKLQSS